MADNDEARVSPQDGRLRAAAITVGAFFGVALLIVLFSSFYVVREWEQVILTQFGHPVGDPVSDAGLHFKTPFVQKVNRFEKRILIWDGERNQVPTDDKRFIWIDTTARWRISDPLTFLQAVRTVAGAQSRLDDYLDSAVRDVIGKHKLVEAVRLTNRVLDMVPVGEEDREQSPLDKEVRERISKGRDVLIEEMLKNAQGKVEELGIELIDLRIKRTLKRSTVAAAFVATFFVVSEFAGIYLSGQLGPCSTSLAQAP